MRAACLPGMLSCMPPTPPTSHLATRGRAWYAAASMLRAWGVKTPAKRSYSAVPDAAQRAEDAQELAWRELREFGKRELEDVGGVKFLRLPLLLCEEWGYISSDDCQPLLLKRNCYDVLSSKIQRFFSGTPRAKSVIVLGSSGIGKSGYCLYFLWELLRGEAEWSMIVLKFAQGSGSFYIFSRENGEVSFSVESDPAVVRKLVKQQAGNVWYLADKEVTTTHWTLPGHCHFLLTCSPAKENHYHFRKYPVSVTYYVPVWSRDEIMQLNKVAFKQTDQEAERAFRMWGGVPRYVLADRCNDILLHAAIKFAAREMVHLPYNSDTVNYLETCHRVFHYDVDAETCELHNIWAPLKFASDFVAAGVAKPLRPSLIDTIAGGTASEKMRAAIFDAFFDRLMERSLPMSTMEMDEQGRWGPTLKEELPLVRFQFMPKSSGNDAILPDQLPPYLLDCTSIKPMSSSNKSWDLIVGRRIVQAMVTGRRDVKRLEVTKGLSEASDFLRRCYGDNAELEFIYIVPRSIFDSFVPTVPGGFALAGRVESVKKFKSTLKVRVKKMCLRVDQALADEEALKALKLLNMSAAICSLTNSVKMETFEDMNLRPSLRQGISNYGYTLPTPLQQTIVGPFSRGQNVLQQAPTGSGCTSAICVAVLQRVDPSLGPFQAVVLAPTESSALQIVRQMLALNSDLKLRSASKDGVDDWHVIVGTPSDAYQVCVGLPKEMLASLSVLAVDEVDEISKTPGGLEEVKSFLSMMPAHRQLGFFGTTMPPAVLDFVRHEAKSFVC